MSTFAGVSGDSGQGSADGTGAEARFFFISAITIDSAGNLFVTDGNNHTIRKITPGAVVTTIAGLAGGPGSLDGTGNAARFNRPDGIAVDDAGNLYIGDGGNRTA